MYRKNTALSEKKMTILQGCLKASYTVEGSFVISICILLVFFTLTTAIGVYTNTYAYVMETKVDNIEAAEWFRRIAFGKEIVGLGEP